MLWFKPTNNLLEFLKSINENKYKYIHSPKSLATLDDEIVYPEITLKLEMWDVLKVDNVQT